nr:MAG TPA: hypothetical protein [Bacteriophage sp.]
MKIFKLITSYIIGFVISVWIIILWLLLVNPYCDTTNLVTSVLPKNVKVFLETDTGFTVLQLLFLAMLFVILILFYLQGYKEGKEKYDVTKNINESNNN